MKILRSSHLAVTLLATALAAQTPQPRPQYVPPASHKNAPQGEIRRMPGDGDGAYKTTHSRDLVTDPKNPTVGYFAWSMATDNSPRSTGPAPDGEEYFVMSLYFAAHRWGNGKGIYDYHAQADKILRGMRHHPVLTATGPFRIHPDDPPFVPPNHPWPSPNNKAREKAAANGGSAAPPFVPR